MLTKLLYSLAIFLAIRFLGRGSYGLPPMLSTLRLPGGPSVRIKLTTLSINTSGVSDATKTTLENDNSSFDAALLEYVTS